MKFQVGIGHLNKLPFLPQLVEFHHDSPNMMHSRDGSLGLVDELKDFLSVNISLLESLLKPNQNVKLYNCMAEHSISEIS